MIRASAGLDVLKFLERVIVSITSYSEIVICSPFIDPALMKALDNLVRAARITQCGVRIITTPTVGKSLKAMLAGHEREWDRTVIVKARLHAKVYVAIARTNRGRSEAIVTSANLTEAGLTSNLEFGVHVASTSEAGTELLRHVQHFVRRLAA